MRKPYAHVSWGVLQYHFGDRERLLMAVLEPEIGEIDARRGALLDDIEARAANDARVLAASLVRPAAAMLTEPAGREYLRIVAQIVNRSDIGTRFETMLAQSPSMARCERMAGRWYCSSTSKRMAPRSIDTCERCSKAIATY